MLCIPIFGMLGVSRETTPFWYEIHTFVLTVLTWLTGHALTCNGMHAALITSEITTDHMPGCMPCACMDTQPESHNICGDMHAAEPAPRIEAGLFVHIYKESCNHLALYAFDQRKVCMCMHAWSSP